MPRYLPLLLLTLIPASLPAQTVRAWQPPFEMEVIDLPVSDNHVAYRLFVRKPLVPPAPGGERPVVVYLLDALWDTPAVAAAESNAEFGGHFPPIYYVGVGYQDENDRVRLQANRTRDYLPTVWAPPDPGQHFLQPVDYEGSGGASAFLDVLERQIFPLVESRYGVSGGTRVVVGKSDAGLLATYALLTRPELFSNYLIISPALWWDDYFLDYRDRAVMRFERDGHARLLAKPTKVWVGMGDGEERLGMLADVYVLSRALRLRNDPNLKLTVDIIPDEVHESVYMPAFTRGLRHLLWR
jgi:predicted alpha/beta superfamily hydrolase